MHATSWKSAGNVSDTAWREMRTARSSSGWRSASRAPGWNSPSSSRNSAPRCASVTSPGVGRPLPPPTSAGTDAVWCGARNGRCRASPPTGAWPATEWMRVTSSASSGSSGGQDRGQTPGEHGLAGAGRTAEQQVVTAGRGRLERPARPREPAHLAEVDVVVARRARRRRERVPVGPRRLPLAAVAQLAEVPRGPHVHAVDERRLGRVARGHDDPLDAPAGQRVDERQHAGNAAAPSRRARARRGRRCPPATSAGSASVATRIPRATARSSPAPCLRTAPGARFTVMRCCGHTRPDDSTAARTRSRDSRTAVSGSPTTVYEGRPGETWTSTVTRWPSTPRRVALTTDASTATSDLSALLSTQLGSAVEPAVEPAVATVRSGTIGRPSPTATTVTRKVPVGCDGYVEVAGVASRDGVGRRRIHGIPHRTQRAHPSRLRARRRRVRGLGRARRLPGARRGRPPGPAPVPGLPRHPRLRDPHRGPQGCGGAGLPALPAPPRGHRHRSRPQPAHPQG